MKEISRILGQKIYLFRKRCLLSVQMLKRRLSFFAYCFFPIGKKFFVIGTPIHSNIGDSAIAIAEIAILGEYIKKKYIKEITFEECNEYFDVLKLAITSKCIIFWHGGGNMGDEWWEEEKLRRRFLCKYDNNIVVFPQTFFYSATQSGRIKEKESVLAYNRKNVTLVARERFSFICMKELYPQARVILTPDIVLSSTMETFGAARSERKGVLLCMRNDLERVMSDAERDAIKSILEEKGIPFKETDMHTDRTVTKVNRQERVRQKMDEFLRVRLVITDRLHGMVFSALTGTPCIVFSNYNHKVRGTYEWIKFLPYIRYAESLKDLKDYIPELISMESCEYDNAKLLPSFEQLSEVIRDYAVN